MIFQILNLIIVEVKFRKLILDAKKFFSLSSEVREKILINGLQFVHNSSFKIRSKKINYLITKMLRYESIDLKSQRTSVKRLRDKIIITQN